MPLARFALVCAVLLSCDRSSVDKPASRPAAAGPGDGENWNDARIAWRGFEEGMAEAARDGKPVCLVLFTTWCPHCRNYSKVFSDERIVAAANDFVMIRVDKDKRADVSRRFAPDGEYIPRTYFIDKTGALAEKIHAPRDRFKYFYDEHDPGSLLAGMSDAKSRLRPNR